MITMQVFKSGSAAYDCSAVRKLQARKVLNDDIVRLDDLLADEGWKSGPSGLLRTVDAVRGRRHLDLDGDFAVHETTAVV